MNIDAVQQRPTNLLLVPRDRHRRAGAFLHRVGVITAGTRIHGRDQHEISGIGNGSLSARDCHNLIFEWLAQNFVKVLPKFGWLIEEKHAAMRQADLARTWNATTAN